MYRECIHMVLDRPLASEPELPRFDAIKRPPTEAKCTSFAPQKLPLTIKCNNMSEKCCVYARNRPNNHLGFSARYAAIYHVLPPTTTRRTTDKPHSTQTNHVRPKSIQGLCQSVLMLLLISMIRSECRPWARGEERGVSRNRSQYHGSFVQ